MCAPQRRRGVNCLVVVPAVIVGDCFQVTVLHSSQVLIWVGLKFLKAFFTT